MSKVHRDRARIKGAVAVGVFRWAEGGGFAAGEGQGGRGAGGGLVALEDAGLRGLGEGPPQRIVLREQ